jgi:hypothetical protein
VKGRESSIRYSMKEDVLPFCVFVRRRCFLWALLTMCRNVSVSILLFGKRPFFMTNFLVFFISLFLYLPKSKDLHRSCAYTGTSFGVYLALMHWRFPDK